MKMINKSKNNAKVKTSCYNCEGYTNHNIISSILKKSKYPEIVEDNEVEEITKKMTYSIIQCLGCDTYSFMETYSYSNDLDEKDKPIIYTSTYPNEENFENDEYYVHGEIFLKQNEIKTLPIIVKKLYIEVTIAFEYEAITLAGMGLRSLLEALCIQRNISGYNLKEKIENLYKAGYISKKEMPTLQKLREMGNATVHQIKKPSSTVLNSALSILNHTLKTIYYIPKMDARIKSKRERLF